MVFCPQNIVKTVRNILDKAILKIIHVSLFGIKTTCPEMGRVKSIFDSIKFRSGPNCSKLGWDNPGLLRNLNSDMEA